MDIVVCLKIPATTACPIYTCPTSSSTSWSLFRISTVRISFNRKLEHFGAADKQAIFGEVVSASHELMMDKFGNYVVQKFLKFSTAEQKQTLVECYHCPCT